MSEESTTEGVADDPPREPAGMETLQTRTLIDLIEGIPPDDRGEGTELVLRGEGSGDLVAELRALLAAAEKVQALLRERNEVEQVLAQALGRFPWLKDDPEVFPGATEADGVCTGHLTLLDVADEAAGRIRASADPTSGRGEEPPCSTPSTSTAVPPDRETWEILCAYLADEEHHHGAGISEGRLAEILARRLGWVRREVRAAWFDAVARGNALIEEDHRRRAALVRPRVEGTPARDTSSKGRSGGAPPSSSSGSGSAGS